MTILTNLCLTPGPLISNIFAVLLYVLESPLLVFWGLTLRSGTYFFVIFLYVIKSMFMVFWGLTFSHQQESSAKVVKSFQYLRAQIEV